MSVMFSFQRRFTTFLCGIHDMTHQVEYHPFQQPNHLMEYCRQEGIVFEGYSPLAKGQVLSDPTVLRIAEKHRRTPAQICIRWSIQVVTLFRYSLSITICACQCPSAFYCYLSSEWSRHNTEIHQKEEDTRKLSSELKVHCICFFSNIRKSFKCSKFINIERDLLCCDGKRKQTLH